MSVCIWLDGGATKACHRLRRLARYLGFRVVCRADLSDQLIDRFAKEWSCIVVTTDKYYRFRMAESIYIPIEYASRKGKKDLALHIIKLVFQLQRQRKPF